MWTKLQILTLVKKPTVVVGAASVASAVAGAAAGYLVADKRLKAKYEQIAEQEIEDAKKFYGQIYKTEAPMEFLENTMGKEAADALLSYQGKKEPKEPRVIPHGESASVDDLDYEEARLLTKVELQAVSIDKEVGPAGGKIISVEKNVFENHVPADLDWDYAVELQIRAENPDRPYILSHDEYFEGEKDYEQVELTYFEGDDVLSDDKDVPVPDPDASVGDDNLVRFGHGSKDENIVYVRNDALEMDFSISRSTGKYATEVLGFDDSDELKHSHRGVRKFRGHDD